MTSMDFVPQSRVADRRSVVAWLQAHLGACVYHLYLYLYLLHLFNLAQHLSNLNMAETNNENKSGGGPWIPLESNPEVREPK